MSLTNAAALLVAAFGVIVAVVLSAATRDVRLALRAALELWTAAGCLHLAADAAWGALGSAALVIAIRKLASFGLRDRDALQDIEANAT